MIKPQSPPSPVSIFKGEKNVGCFRKEKVRKTTRALPALTEGHHKGWERELSGLTWKLHIQERRKKRHQGVLSFQNYFCFNDNSTGYKVGQPILSVHVWVYTPSLTFAQLPALSHIYTPWFTWPVSNQRSQKSPGAHSLTQTLL